MYRAWALPHLKDALQKPTVQISHNRFSFFWQQHNHPEYPYTNKTPEILLNVFPGESSTECARIENETKSITCNSHIPPGHRHNDVNVATEDNCNVIRYELDKRQNPCNHNALAVLTRRSSLYPKIIRELNLQPPFMKILTVTQKTTKYDTKLQKSPKTHHICHTSSVY